MAFTVYIDFDDGSGERNVTNLCLAQSFQRRMTLWQELTPQTNYCSFQMQRDSTIISKFLTSTAKEYKVRILDGATTYFKGLIRKNFKVTTAHLPLPISVECVDYSGVWLKKVIDTTFLWAGYKVCDPADTSHSFVHQLLTKAGYTSSEWNLTDTISTTVDYFANAAGEGAPTYEEVLTQILFEFGYVWTHQADGKFAIYNYLPTSVTAAATIDNSNMVGQLTVERKESTYEAAEVYWYTHKTENDKIVFSETRGGGSGLKCNVSMAAGDHYPPNADTIPAYAEYKYGDKELIAVQNIVADVSLYSGLTQNTFTNYYKRAQVDYSNESGSTKYLNRFDIKGNVTYRDQLTITKRMPATTEKIFKLDAKYIDASALADKIADGIYQYFTRATMVYSARTRTYYAPGTILSIAETNLGISQTVVVVQVTNDIQSGEYQYTLEGISAFSAAAVTSRQIAEPPAVPQLSPGEIVVAASDWYGYYDLKCDGTDDEAEINSVIQQGKIARLTKGTYYCTDNIMGGLDNSGIIGNGFDTVLDFSGALSTASGYEGHIDYAYDSADRTNLILKNFTLLMTEDTDTYTDPVQGIVIHKAITCLFENIYIRFRADMGSYAGGLHAYSKESVFRNITVDGGWFGPTTAAEDFQGIGIYQGGDDITGVLEGLVVKNLICYLESVDETVLNGIEVSSQAQLQMTRCVVESLYAAAWCTAFSIVGVGTITSCVARNIRSWGNNTDQTWGVGFWLSNDRVKLIGCSAENCDKPYRHESNYASIENNSCEWSGSFLEDGNCEVRIPHPKGETAGSSSNVTISYDSTHAFVGLKSMKVVKNIAAGTAGYVYFVDGTGTGDMHGFRRVNHDVRLRLYVPTTGGPDLSEAEFYWAYYNSGAWTEHTHYVAAKDSWQEIIQTETIPSTATGLKFGIRFKSTAEINEYFWVQCVSVNETKPSNYEESVFFTPGDIAYTWTQKGNSWETVQVHAMQENLTLKNWDSLDYIEATTGTSTLTLTLPYSYANKGREIVIQKIDSGSGKITVNRAGVADTIDGQASFDISGQYNKTVLRSNGTNMWTRVLGLTVYQ